MATSLMVDKLLPSNGVYQYAAQPCVNIEYLMVRHRCNAYVVLPVIPLKINISVFISLETLSGKRLKLQPAWLSLNASQLLSLMPVVLCTVSSNQ